MLHSASLDFSPELPQLQTINLRDIINPRRAQRSDTPEVPELQTINLRDISNKENNTPEIPVLQTSMMSPGTLQRLQNSLAITGATVQERQVTPQRPQDFCLEIQGHFPNHLRPQSFRQST